MVLHEGVSYRTLKYFSLNNEVGVSKPVNFTFMTTSPSANNVNVNIKSYFLNNLIKDSHSRLCLFFLLRTVGSHGSSYFSREKTPKDLLYDILIL